ncbi:MAG: hypothetical protein V4671_26970 [Armatimonadota bacterium]
MRLAAQRVAHRLKLLTIGKDREDPKTWRDVAERLVIGVAGFDDHRAMHGCLTFIEAHDRWVIELNTFLKPRMQARILIHELAHYLLRTMLGIWLCDDQTVYHYDGRVDDMRHRIARRVERLVLGSC